MDNSVNNSVPFRMTDTGMDGALSGLAESGCSREPVALPESVWAHVASYMSVRDWARVSGTCRITTKVKLQSMDLTDGFPNSGASFLPCCKQ